MKIVLDTMLWVSNCSLKDGYRHRLIERARRQRVRFFVSEILEVGKVEDVEILTPQQWEEKLQPS